MPSPPSPRRPALARAAVTRVVAVRRTTRRTRIDFGGWTAPEFRAYAAGPSRAGDPERRAGREVVAHVNAHSGSLPVDAVLMARAIADTAPAVGEDINPTLSDLLSRYLPESLHAFDISTRRGANEAAEALLLSQLRLLHQVAGNIEQAERQHNERDLQIQAAFLQERFANLTPGHFDIGERATATPSVRSLAAPAKARARTAPTQGRAYLQNEIDPVVLFSRASAAPWNITLRLALPKGLPATLGCVIETPSGATEFTHRSNRRIFAQRRPTGFRAPQVDLTLAIKQAAIKRFFVYAQSHAVHRDPVETVLFMRSDNGSQADLATLLTNNSRAPLTVVATAYDTADGLLVRNESTLYADLRAACAGFGFGNITWLDAHTPVL